MRSSLQLGLTVVVLLGVAVPPCIAGAELTKILTKITDTILLMIGETGSSVTFLGHPCLVVTAKQPNGDYAAQMSCCSWTDIIGEGEKMRQTLNFNKT
nr:scygonadin isoform 5 [Scylla paramamosain]